MFVYVRCANLVWYEVEMGRKCRPVGLDQIDVKKGQHFVYRMKQKAGEGKHSQVFKMAEPFLEKAEAKKQKRNQVQKDEVKRGKQERILDSAKINDKKPRQKKT